MKKHHILAIGAAFSAFAAGTALAGPVDTKAPVIQDPVCAVPFTGEVSVGYESDYIFRGTNFGEDAPWASIGLNSAINDVMSVDVGVWYINPTNNPSGFDELDLYAFLNFPLGPLSASFGGTWYYFPEPGGNTGEVSLGLSKDLGIAELGVFAAHDFDDLGGWYFEARALRSIPLTACLDLNLGAGVSYGEEYFGVSGWNNIYVRAGLGYHLTESATLNAYVGGNFLLDGLEDVVGATQDDELHGGASISVAF